MHTCIYTANMVA